MSKKSKMAITSLLIFIGLGTYLYITSTFPQFEYEITVSTPNREMEEPLTFDIHDKEVNFYVRFVMNAGEVDEALMYKSVNFNVAPPFIRYSDTLTMRVYNADGIRQEHEVLYKMSGRISNLKLDKYKVRLIDQYDNLIDERIIELNGNKVVEEEMEEPLSADLMKQCLVDEDCVPVGCGCACSGCGGFDYDDILNKKYESEWYKNAECSKPEVCLMVCCPPRKAACVNSECVVIELEEDIKD